MKYDIEGLKILARNAGVFAKDISSIWSVYGETLGNGAVSKYFAAQVESKIIVWHKETCRLLKSLDKQAYQDFIGPKVEQKYWNSLVIEDVFRFKETATLFLEFLETKHFLLNKIVAAHEGSEHKKDFTTGDTDEIRKKLPLYIKPDIGIFSRENSEIPFFPLTINRNYVFLEGCIELCNSEFKVSGSELFKYLVKNKARLPRHLAGFERKKDKEIWEYIRQSFNELKKEKKIANVSKFIILESHLKACIKWQIDNKN